MNYHDSEETRANTGTNIYLSNSMSHEFTMHESSFHPIPMVMMTIGMGWKELSCVKRAFYELFLASNMLNVWNDVHDIEI